MKRVHYYILGIVILIAVTILSSWAGSHHSAKSLNEQVATSNGAVHLSLKTRYTVINEIVSEVESSDATIAEHIATINSEHTKFNSNLTIKSLEEINEVAQLLDHTFNNLVTFLVANKDKYTPFTLEAPLVSRYTAATNAAIVDIKTYNESVEAYNTNLKVFPNIIYLSFFAPKDMWDLSPLVATLPSFA